MKRVVPFMLCVVVLFALFVCAGDAFGHETFTSTDAYPKIFELTELRFKEDAFELFPKEVEYLEVQDFYCEWELGIVGSAKAEIALSVNYTAATFADEVERLKGLANGKAIYDEETFQYPAYVTVLGYKNTSYYALVDAQEHMIHYVLLQIIDVADIDINKEFLPRGYGESGEVQNVSYNMYE